MAPFERLLLRFSCYWTPTNKVIHTERSLLRQCYNETMQQNCTCSLLYFCDFMPFFTRAGGMYYQVCPMSLGMLSRTGIPFCMITVTVPGTGSTCDGPFRVAWAVQAGMYHYCTVPVDERHQSPVAQSGVQLDTPYCKVPLCTVPVIPIPQFWIVLCTMHLCTCAPVQLCRTPRGGGRTHEAPPKSDYRQYRYLSRTVTTTTATTTTYCGPQRNSSCWRGASLWRDILKKVGRIWQR
jgi:hypothetical protein